MCYTTVIGTNAIRTSTKPWYFMILDWAVCTISNRTDPTVCSHVLLLHLCEVYSTVLHWPLLDTWIHCKWALLMRNKAISSLESLHLLSFFKYLCCCFGYSWLLLLCVNLYSVNMFLIPSAPVISITEAGRDTAENGREPRLELASDSKVCGIIFFNIICVFIICVFRKKQVFWNVLSLLLSRRNCWSLLHLRQTNDIL